MTNSVPRRRFLKTTVATAAGAAMAAQVKAASSPNERVVIGIMGLERGHALAKQFAQVKDVHIKYLCDVDTDRAGRSVTDIKKRGQTSQAIGDFRRILDDKEVDALVCAAPNHWHGPATILGCAAGKHVYVEKPCSHNPAEGEMMIRAARQSNVAVHRRLFKPLEGCTTEPSDASIHRNARTPACEGRSGRATKYRSRRISIMSCGKARRLEDPTTTMSSTTIGIGAGTGGTVSLGTMARTLWIWRGGD